MLVVIGLTVARAFVQAATLVVGDCAAGEMVGIQAAVDAADDGDTINVRPGTYPEQVLITKTLTLKGVANAQSRCGGRYTTRRAPS